MGLARKARGNEPTEKTNHLADTDPDTVKLLNESNFATDSAISDEKLELELDGKTGAILKSSSAKIFDKVVTELIAKNSTFHSLVVPLHQEKIKTLLTEDGPILVPTPTIVCILNDKKEVWVLELNRKENSKKVIFELKDRTRVVGEQLGKLSVKKLDEPEVKNKAVDLILFRHKESDKSLKKWVTKIATLLKKAELWPAENRPKFIALRYEEDAVEKSDFNHPFIDDLIYLPFDRLIFLQKTEIALGLPKKVSPSFLFVQEAKDSIEIAKRIMIEKVCDLGIGVKNPIPLSFGTAAHFYFKFHGQKFLVEVYAKALRSVPHPEEEGQFLVYFSYFAINKLMNKEIKSYLNRDTGYKNLVDSNSNNFAYNPDSIFLTDEQKARKNVVVIDHDHGVAKNIAEYLKTETGNVNVITDDSYFQFYRKYFDQKPNTEKAPNALPEDFYAEMVSILVNVDDLKIQMPLTPPTEEDRFLGHEIQKVYSEPQGWLVLFDGDARNLLLECIHLAANTKRVLRNFELKHLDESYRTVSLEFALEDNAKVMRINFKLPDSKATAKLGAIHHLDSIDCLLIDYNLLPDDLDSFFRGLDEGIRKTNIKSPIGGLRIIVLLNENQKINLDLLIRSKVFNVLYKPIEVRRLLFLVVEAIASPFSVYNFENIGWKKDNIGGKIARPAALAELSEFGAIVKSELPLKPGTMIYLFRSIYTQAPDQHLCVRIYHSQENEAEKGTFLNAVIYFGITDAFLKYTRSYIRETYAAKKLDEGNEE